MKLSSLLVVAFAALCLASIPGGPAADKHNPPAALAGATVLLIRHAEKPAHGDGLSPAGVARADAYVNYFENYSINSSAPIELTALFAAANSSSSHRPVLTLTPLSESLGLPIEAPYKDNDDKKLAELLQSTNHGQSILVCWHQGEMPDLIKALGADPKDVLPGGNWPEDEYGWVIQLQYDADGKVTNAQRIVEDL